MSSLSFPDVNVWLALILEHHTHRPAALDWWNAASEDEFGFTRITQLGVLRLLTTAAAMDGKPLTIKQGWAVYDRLLQDERVGLYAEPSGFDTQLRRFSTLASASPKVWADAHLLAFAASHGASVVTFDSALEARGVPCRVLR